MEACSGSACPQKRRSLRSRKLPPYAITSIISKVFESLINIKLSGHLETLHLLSDHQYGFRSSHSCGDFLAYVSHTWDSFLKDYGESVAIALDISKAFDRVWYRQLIAKLPSFGFKLITSFLSNRSIVVRVDGHSSPSLMINSGVPQGSVLSPTLFLLFINDLLSTTTNPIHSYADDSTLHVSSGFRSAPGPNNLLISRRSIVTSMNKDLQSNIEWGDTNLVKFNSSKTQCTVFSLKQESFKPSLIFNEANINADESLSMLGLTFKDDLSWKSHITSLAKSASQKLGILFRFRNYFTNKQLLTLYVGTIRPCMEYCCHIWGRYPEVDLLDKVQSKAFCLISSSTLTDSLPSLSLRRDVTSLSLFCRYYFGM